MTRSEEPPTEARAGAWWGRWWFLEPQASWFPRLYEAFFTRIGWSRRLRQEEQQPISAAIRGCLADGDRVVEVGSGTGVYTALLDDYGATVQARDASPAMVGYLRRRLAREGRSVDADRGALPDDLRVVGPVDGIVAVGVLNYLDDLAACLGRCATTLRPGGWAVFNVPSPVRAGRRYIALEALVRRRVHVWSPQEVTAAATQAGLSVCEGPLAAGITDVYVCRRSS